MALKIQSPAHVTDMASLVMYISKIIAAESGNILEETQKVMVESKLKKRMIDLGDLNPQGYFDYLQKNYASESYRLLSLITNHHTFFFREFSHYEFVQKNLASIVKRVRARGDNKIRILSAACSKGQEVYSLAMLMEVNLKAYPDISYEITGTDIDAECVKIGKNGVYQYSEVKSIPHLYLTGNWQRGTGEISHFAKVKKHIREKVNFFPMNLLNAKSALGNSKFDFIFCRNVFIYLEMETVFSIVKELKEHIYPQGFLITGLSESLKTLDMHKRMLEPSVYSFDKELEIVKEEPIAEVLPTVVPKAPSIPSPIKVLAVDDSSSILKLLTKIFEKDPEFELVGTAMNGIEAEEFIKNNQVDAMTLDIHMPEMDGVEYLKKNYSSSHPHVVMVSSASREDTTYAQQALKSGACDFVEKPALNNLAERAEEIKIKLKMAFMNQSQSIEQLDHDFKNDFVIDSPDNKARVFFANYSEMKKLKGTFKMMKGTQPPTLVLFEGNNNLLDVIASELGAEVYEEGKELSPSKIYICDFKEHSSAVKEQLKDRKLSMAVFGIASQKTKDWVLDFENFQLLLDDTPDLNEDLKAVASDIFPWTSFAHVGTEYLAKD